MRSNDEMYNIVSGTLAALIPSGTPSNELRDHTEHLIVRLRDPYFRLMLTQLASKDWFEVIKEELLPLRERLAIAFQFLEDKALSFYLRRTTDCACTRGDIEGLIIAGLTPTGMDMLQGYVREMCRPLRSSVPMHPTQNLQMRVQSGGWRRIETGSSSSTIALHLI
ncbi:hypothetical protein AZE42_06255 [Rhizopogon vesiculosus]|uniref:Uncharacterized protein n=1 Tax=Rhizopogon vesiculosus TaxID=180088 RepID=A0A1J8PLR9_9AGAM|nr:hypothetical protein AZE42_06255 [Rhizopogon vesiculosus]